MSQKMLPPDKHLSFAERQPILYQIWVDTLKLSKEQVAIPLVMSVANFLNDYSAGRVTSAPSAVKSIFVSCLIGVILYLLINIIRAPFIVIGKQHRQITHLTQRLADDEVTLNEVEARPPVVIEKVAESVAALPEPKHEPNLVYVKSEIVEAYKDINENIIEGHLEREQRTNEEVNLRALVAVFH